MLPTSFYTQKHHHQEVLICLHNLARTDRKNNQILEYSKQYSAIAFGTFKTIEFLNLVDCVANNDSNVD